MEVYPAINCKDRECFVERLEVADSIFDKDTWLHIDISDGEYTQAHSFYDADIIKSYSDCFKFEGHLMVAGEKLLVDEWYEAGFDRLLFQADAVEDWEPILKKASEHGIEVGAVVGFEESFKIPEEIGVVEVLAVPPGASGQAFDKRALDTVRALRKKREDGIILVDGGVNEDTGKLIEGAGADVLVASSFIWGTSDPAGAYEKLRGI